VSLTWCGVCTDLGEDGSAEFLGVGDEGERVDTVLALGDFLLIGTR
jgi:hypothetical protein